MTVKCLTDQDKVEIAELYVAKIPTDQLARTYEVSKRTINRVLVEQSANRFRHRRPKYTPHGLPIDMFDLPEPKAEEIPTLTQVSEPQPQPTTQEAPVPEPTFFENLKAMFMGVFLRSNKTNDQVTR